MNKDTKTLTEGAVLAALTVLISTLYLYLPLPLLVAIPVPLLVLTYRHGISSAIPVAFVAALLAGLFSHLVQGVVLVLSMGALGLALGEALRQGFGPIRTLFWGTLVMTIVSIATFLITLWITGINSLDTMVKSVTESYTTVTELYQKMGLGTEALPMTAEQFGQMVRLIFPATLVVSSATIAGLSYWLGGMVLAKLGSPVPRLPKLTAWIFPRWLGFSTLGLMLVLLLPLPVWLSVVVTNLYYVGILLLALEGLALAWHLISRLTVGKTVKVILLVLLFLLLPWLLVWGGFADNLADYRGLRRGRDESHLES